MNTETAPKEAGRKARKYPNGHWASEQYRRRYLPQQLIAARRKVEMLEREAVRLGIEVAQ